MRSSTVCDQPESSGPPPVGDRHHPPGTPRPTGVTGTPSRLPASSFTSARGAGRQRPADDIISGVLAEFRLAYAHMKDTQVSTRLPQAQRRDRRHAPLRRDRGAADMLNDYLDGRRTGACSATSSPDEDAVHSDFCGNRSDELVASSTIHVLSGSVTPGALMAADLTDTSSLDAYTLAPRRRPSGRVLRVHLRHSTSICRW